MSTQAKLLETLLSGGLPLAFEIVEAGVEFLSTRPELSSEQQEALANMRADLRKKEQSENTNGNSDDVTGDKL